MGQPHMVRDAHVEFVSGHTGTSGSEVISSVFAVFPALLVTAIVVQGRRGWRWFTTETILLVLPLAFSLTILSDFTFELGVSVTLVAFLALVLASHFRIPISKQGYKDEKRLGCVTTLRGMLNLVAAVVILAVDFHSFPRRFAKTEEYGYSLMDMGAVGFVIANGIVEGRKKPSKWLVLRDGLVLILLGLGRLWLVHISDYQHHITEYGVHANFFFTLAFVKIACSWWVWKLNLSRAIFAGVFICVCHQLCLTIGGLQVWVLSSSPRHNLFSANREWVVSLPGYVASYFFGVALGCHLFARHYRKRRLTFSVICLTMYLLICVVGLHHYLGLPSRRIANITFIVYAVFFTTMALAIYLTLEILAATFLLDLPTVPIIFHAINRRPLHCFLLANVLTGIINKTINTLDVPYPWDIGIIITYTLGILFVLYYLFLQDDHKRNKKINY